MSDLSELRFKTLQRVANDTKVSAKAVKRWLTVATLTLLLAVSASPGMLLARGVTPEQSASDAVKQADLPPQGRDVLAQIYRGSAFRHEKDGAVFGNRERLLPSRKRGYYREYTVRTPGERSRGARRIVCGGDQPAAPDACYYTDDHYASFRKIVQ